MNTKMKCPLCGWEGVVNERLDKDNFLTHFWHVHDMLFDTTADVWHREFSEIRGILIHDDWEQRIKEAIGT